MTAASFSDNSQILTQITVYIFQQFKFNQASFPEKNFYLEIKQTFGSNGCGKTTNGWTAWLKPGIMSYHGLGLVNRSQSSRRQIKEGQVPCACDNYNN